MKAARKKAKPSKKPKPPHKSKNVQPGKLTGIKPTDKELDERVTACELMLARGGRVSQIHDAICNKYGVHWQTVDRYLLRARENLRQRFGKSREEHRNDSFTFYESVIMAGDSGPGAKIRARQRIDELLGLDAPKRAEISGPEGGPIAFGEVKVYLPAKRSIELVESNGDGEHDRS